ncbi:transposon Ty3-I Gag-Pol polyprotein [Trichonephila clavipes]|nr:transposon Ty3-I Gag-Pol polyprotein [Trichonephila clavipes]
MEAFPMPDIRAETVADNILKGWISRFGTPLVITTDQGTQFEAQLFQELSKLIGFKCNKTTTYHPQANGCIERWHSTLAELLYGENIRLPWDFFEEILFQPQSEFVQTLKATIKDFKPVPFPYRSKQKPFTFKDLKDCSHVFSRTDSARQSLQSPYHGPYRLKPCFSNNSSESDTESSIGEDTPNKPAEMPVKKIRFAPLPLPTSTRATRGGRQVRLPVRYHPPVNPEPEMDDPNDVKPADWDEREKIPHPTATKPDDW